MIKNYIKGIGMMLGITIGAGIFALPYSFAKAGLFWGMVHFFVAFLMVLLLNALYGQVSYYTSGRHRLTGYAEIYIGKWAKYFSLLTTMASFYGSLLAYGLLGGLFAANLFSLRLFGMSSGVTFSLLFFTFGGLLVYLKMSKVAEINFYLSLPFFGFLVYLIIAALPHINFSHLFGNIDYSFNSSWFLPFGVWFFAITGFSGIPEVRDVVNGSSVNVLKRVVNISMALAAVSYLLFVFSVWGSGNSGTTQDALSGIEKVLGHRAFIVGSIMGLLAVFNSFLVLAVDTRNVYRLDFGVARPIAWLLAILPPIALFLAGIKDFVKVIDVIGVLGLGSTGTLIILMSYGLKKKIKAGDTALISLPAPGEKIGTNNIFVLLVFLGIFASVAYELFKIFG